MADIGRVQDGNSPWQMLLSVPPVVRFYFLGMMVVTIGSLMGFVPERVWLLDWPQVIGNLQIWRCFFAFFHLGKLEWGTIFLLMILFQQGVYLEQVTFFGSVGDFMYFLGIVGSCILAFDFFMPSYILAQAMMFAWMQVWARHNPDQRCKVMFVLEIKAVYLPLAYVMLNFVLSGGRIPWSPIKGVVAGQIYYFMTMIYPKLPGRSPVLATPNWVRKLFNQSYDFNAPANPPTRSTGTFTSGASDDPAQGRPSFPGLSRRSGGGHSWGSGQRLGS